MDRLTRRMCGGYGMVEGHELSTLHGMKAAVNRLAAYEDTGLTPEEIYKLCEMEKRSRMAQMLRWEEAEAAGRLLVLPCKPGDTVMAYLDGPTLILSECTISRIEYDKDYKEPLFTAICYESAAYNTFWLSDFGTEIFTLDQYWSMMPEATRKGGKKKC